MMKRLPLLIAAAALAAGAASLNEAPAEAPKKISVAVVDLSAEGMTKQEITALSDRLRTELFNTGKFTVMERGQMNEVMKEQGFQQSGACSEEACLVQMGQLLGVNKLVAGSLGKLGSMYLINIRIINVGSGLIEKTVAEDCRCQIEGLINSLRNVAYKLANTGETPPPAPVEPAPLAAPAALARTPAPAAPPGVFLYGKQFGFRFVYEHAGMANGNFNDMLDNLSLGGFLTSGDDSWGSLGASELEIKIPFTPNSGLRVVGGFGLTGVQYGLSTWFNDFYDSTYGLNIDRNYLEDISYDLTAFPISAGFYAAAGNRFQVNFAVDFEMIPATLNYAYKGTHEDYDYQTFSYLGGGSHEEHSDLTAFGTGFRFMMGMEFFPAKHFSLGADFFYRITSITDFNGNMVIDYNSNGNYANDGNEIGLAYEKYSYSFEEVIPYYEGTGDYTPAEIDLSGMGFRSYFSFDF